MSVTLAITHHDPEGRLNPQLDRHLPLLTNLFDGIAVHSSPQANSEALARLERVGASIAIQERVLVGGTVQIGRVRREVIQQALAFETSHVLYCDGDRMLHWAEHYAHELTAVVGQIQQTDCTVLGRTERAYDSHPRIQRETERLINHAYHLISGNAWDITAAARGLSVAAVEAIVAECPDDTFGVDGTWPLTIQRLRERGPSNLTLAYVETEGLEFETAAQFQPEIAEIGSVEAWMAGLDLDVEKWAVRLKLATIEVEAMLAYRR